MSERSRRLQRLLSIREMQAGMEERRLSQLRGAEAVIAGLLRTQRSAWQQMPVDVVGTGWQMHTAERALRQKALMVQLVACEEATRRVEAQAQIYSAAAVQQKQAEHLCQRVQRLADVEAVRREQRMLDDLFASRRAAANATNVL